ncbi:MAG: dipeptide ABC transporter ATP-binding protein [Betaproteobacteria bacterium]|nr:dipeptide ABC transporter ATP-binding protein [Betaproteobacteria bacterium]
MSAILEATGLVKHFAMGSGLFARAAGVVKAVDGVSFAVGAGESHAIVGESGCGKSTVARLVLRLIEPTAGAVRLEGRDLLALAPAELRAARRHIQIVFQDPYGSLNPRMTVGQMLTEPLMLHEVVAPARRHERVAELLRVVGLQPDSAQRYPHEFSGGQRQRLAVARALAAEPRVIVCDEPVSALDVSIQAQILNLLADLQQRLGLAYVIISHDLAVVHHIATSVGVMYLGRFVESGPSDAVFERPKHPYTQALLSSVPVPEPGRRSRRIVLQGDVPSPLAPPSGCHFHPRCAHAIARCREEAPLAEAKADGGTVACHRWRELEAWNTAVTAGQGNRAALARLQAAFTRPFLPGESPPAVSVA